MRSAIYFITTVTAKRRPLFRSSEAAAEVGAAMWHYHTARWVHCFAWVVMPDHIHWLVQLRTGTLATLMQRFKTWSAMRVRRLAVDPPPPRVWQPGYHERRVREHEALERYVGYIVGNPVRAGLCNDPLKYPHVYGESELLGTAGREPDLLDDALPWTR